MSVLIDTSLLIDYLNGEQRAERVLEGLLHRAVSVVTWLEVMTLAPPDFVEDTRGFLRTFERLSTNEAIADEALRLMQAQRRLPYHRALTWATARVNQLRFVTVDPTDLPRHDPQIEIPYEWTAARPRGHDQPPAREAAPAPPCGDS